MKNECYHLALYCDHPTAHPDYCDFALREGEGKLLSEFTGPTRRDCMRQARAAGWKLGRQDLCPRCVRRAIHAVRAMKELTRSSKR
jgi:hypothetical protein